MAHVTFPKPAKGSALMERKDRRRAMDAFEDAEKCKVRLRDRECRWPGCDYCRTYKSRLEVAHLHDKGMGGDHGVRSTSDQMMLLCFLRHQGPVSLHSGDCRITPLTDRGTDGPCKFEQQSESGWRVVHVEDGR
jgi:hypothetical protein